MNKEQKIHHITQGFIGDIFGKGSVKHKIINRNTNEESHLQWVGGCFGCCFGKDKVDAYTIIRNDNFAVKLI